MHFQFVTYRWGKDLFGGAELHHRRLAQELLDAGHKVSVLTTTGHGFRQFCHWGAIWDSFETAIGDDEGISVHRYPIKPSMKWQLAWDAKRLQQHVEEIDQHPVDEFYMLMREAAGTTPGLHLINGFHYPELQGENAVRWSMPNSRFLVTGFDKLQGTFTVKGHAPKPNHLRLYVGEAEVGDQKVEPGHFEFSVQVNGACADILRLSHDSHWRPLADFRTLGAQIHEATFTPDAGGELRADLWNDHRSLGRRRPREWQDWLLRRSDQLLGWGRKIDRLRGPRSYRLRVAVEESKADMVIHCNMPWATTSRVREGDLAMPLWHIEDEYYYWPHWIRALKRARFVLANTPYTAEDFFPRLGIKAHFVGPPIWQPEALPTREDIEPFTRKHGLEADKVTVLTVSRKSAEKRYDAIAASVARLHEAGVAVQFIGVGPEVDQRPFSYPGCKWIGPLRDDELQCAYAACDVFCLMSESESFGMVIPEAWHHGKPVVVNSLCGPAASLVRDGETGLLAEPGPDLDSALRRLVENEQERHRMGEAGKTEASSKYVRGSAAKRLLAALEGTKSIEG